MFIMIAATRPEQGLTDTLTGNAKMLRQLRALPYSFRRAIGVWERDMEVSFQVVKPVTSPIAEFVEELEQIAADYSQDAILLVQDDRQAYLRGIDGTETHLGLWQEVGEESLQDLSGYTIINGQAYAAL